MTGFCFFWHPRKHMRRRFSMIGKRQTVSWTSRNVVLWRRKQLQKSWRWSQLSTELNLRQCQIKLVRIWCLAETRKMRMLKVAWKTRKPRKQKAKQDNWQCSSCTGFYFDKAHPNYDSDWVARIHCTARTATRDCCDVFRHSLITIVESYYSVTKVICRKSNECIALSDAA